MKKLLNNKFVQYFIFFLFLFFGYNVYVWFSGSKKKEDEEPERGIKMRGRSWFAIIVDPWNIWYGA